MTYEKYASEYVKYDAKADQAIADGQGARSIISKVRNQGRAEVLREVVRDMPLFLATIGLLIVQAPLWLALLS